jgi:hypothetical protein
MLISGEEGDKVTYATTIERECHSFNKAPTNYLLKSKCKVPATKALAIVFVGIMNYKVKKMIGTTVQ